MALRIYASEMYERWRELNDPLWVELNVDQQARWDRFMEEIAELYQHRGQMEGNAWWK
jgi:hypothetical protein